MNAKVIVGATLVVPPRALMECSLQAVLPLRQRLVANVQESRTLAGLRDTLLPKLISGELQVPDTERIIKGTVSASDAERSDDSDRLDDSDSTVEQLKGRGRCLGKAS